MSAEAEDKEAAEALVLDADDVSVVQELLDALSVISEDNVRALLEQTHATSTPLPHTDAQALRTLFAAHVLRLGVQRLLHFVPKPLMRTLRDAAHLGSHGAQQQQAPQSQQAQAELERAMLRHGLRRFLHERLDVSALRALCQALGVEALARDAAREASQREQQIADEVMLMGAESALLVVNAALLRVLAKELQLDVTGSSGSVEALVDALMAAIFNLEPLDKKKLAHKQRQREEEEERARLRDKKRVQQQGGSVRRGKSRYKAPPLSNIKRGITKQELHDLYNFTDLQDYCKEHGLDYTGKKAILMRRIIAYLDAPDAATAAATANAAAHRKRKHH